MIKDYKVQEAPDVELGNLGLNNASWFYVVKDPRDYPLARFGRKTKTGESFSMSLDNPDECPRGYKIRDQYDDPYDMLRQYAQELKEEHADLTDERINQEPSFYGRKRSARWNDERRRRGLIN